MADRTGDIVASHRLDEHGKYLLMAPSLDRAGTIGFRCVRDAKWTASSSAPPDGE